MGIHGYHQNLKNIYLKKMRKNNNLFWYGIILLSLFVWHSANAQEQPRINYDGQLVVDSDLDGLTDQGEIQLYQTDPNKSDTDGDNFNDSVEVLSGTDPLDVNLYPGSASAAVGIVSQQSSQQNEAPVAWYITRVSGLLAFSLLYISIFLGLTLRVPFLRRIFSPAHAMSVHCWISVQAIFFVLVHSLSLLFDKMFAFKLADLFIPFASSFEPTLMALGIFGLYLMVILVATSYGRKFISQKVWRVTHFMNIILYGIVFLHALYLGTDLKIELWRNIFIWANAVLVFLMLVNVELRIKDAILRKKSQQAI